MVFGSPQQSPQMNQHQVEVVRNVIDGTMVVVAVASFTGLITSAAALASLAWTSMRMYEMVTGKLFSESLIARWINRKK